MALYPEGDSSVFTRPKASAIAFDRELRTPFLTELAFITKEKWDIFRAVQERFSFHFCVKIEYLCCTLHTIL